jgi:hypothetical protein
MRKVIWGAAACAVAAVVVAAAAASTMRGHQVTVSNPYARCPITPDIFGGTNYLDTEVEPWVAKNLASPDNLIGAYQQDRWDDGGAKGLAAAYSFDNGSSWKDVALPFSSCAAPTYGSTPCPINGVGSRKPCTMPYDRASDPFVDIGPDGRAYQVSISFNANDNNNAIGATVSTDGGKTWGLATEVMHDLDSDPIFPFNDKESVTADPTVAGSAYIVWDRLILVDCAGATPSLDAPSSDSRHWGAQSATHGAAPVTGAAASLDCFEGPTYFSKTVDGGRSWSKPVSIVPNSPNEQTIANQIVVDPRSGRLYDFYVYFPNTAAGTPELRMVYSDNKGATWSKQQFINTEETVEIHDPDNPDQVARTGDIIPVPAIDRRTGRLYLVWQDGRFNKNGQDDVLISTSANGGLTGTWSSPQTVDLPADRAGFTPGIKVNDRGEVGVDYYSLRSPQDGPDRWPADRFLRISSAPDDGHGGDAQQSQDRGGRKDAQLNFGDPIRVGGPFNMYMTPNAGGWFVGDYEGMAVDRNGRAFHTFFAEANCDGTDCPSIGTPAPATGSVVETQPRKDPVDVYTDTFTSG